VSRIVSGESPVTLRNRLSKAIVLAIRELMQQKQPNDQSKDLAAFIILSLESITGSINKTVIAWEKRDYWLKADKFRMEWAWTESLGKALQKSLTDESWEEIGKISIKIGEKFHNIRVSNSHRMGKPWSGAYEILKEKENGKQKRFDN